jgi:hypothetical protein
VNWAQDGKAATYGYVSSERLHCKQQTRPLVREDTVHEEARNCQTKQNLKSGDTKKNWPIDRLSQNQLRLELSDRRLLKNPSQLSKRTLNYER